MAKKLRFVEQAKVFEIIGEPKGYSDLTGWQKHNLRQNARIVYERELNDGRDHNWAAYLALEGAQSSARFHIRQNRLLEIQRRCGAKIKSAGRPCKMKPLPGRNRCKFHGGLSTGPKTTEGKIRALSSLKQYRNRPDLLAKKIASLS